MIGDKIVKKFKEFTFSKKKFISSVIDEEVRKSRKLGLELSKEDINFEKNVIITIFNYLWDSIESCKSGGDYRDLRNVVNHYVDKKLDHLKKKYFDLCKDKPVKNMYNCHIDSCISSLFIKINNKIYD